MPENTDQIKQANPFKQNLLLLILSGFCSGAFFISSLWLLIAANNVLISLFSLPLFILSVLCLLIGLKLHSIISLDLEQKEQSHLQHTLTQAKEMLGAGKNLRDEHVLLQSLLHNLPYPIWLKDRFGRYLVANKCFIQQWSNGVDPKGKTDEDILNSAVADAFIEADQITVSTKQAQKLELRLDIQGQTPRWVRIERRPLFDDGGKVVALIGSAVDISSYKETVPTTTDESNTTSRH